MGTPRRGAFMRRFSWCMGTVAAWILLLAGCSADDVVAYECDAPCIDAFTPNDAQPRDFCQGSGPLIVGGEACLGRLAESSFRYALCTCRGIVTGDGLLSDSFDSRLGPYRAPGQAGGSIGSGGGILAGGPWTIEGSLRASNADGTTSTDAVAVAGGVYHQGPLAGPSFDIGGDAELGGGVQAQRLVVGGTLLVPADEAVDVEGEQDVGALERGPVQVAPPCACDAEGQLDIDSIVRAQADDNDNARIGLSVDALASVPEAVTLELPCGLYYFSRVVANGPLTIRANGRVALFIRGDVSASDLSIEINADAELDLFIAGNLTVDASIRIGRTESPSRTRVYIGGGGSIGLPPLALIAANLYAPRSELVASGSLEAFGSLFVERLSVEGALQAHFDSNVLEVGGACLAPDACDDCSDCPGTQACVDGSCGECRSDADCCAPLTCSAGRCDATVL